ALQSRADYLAGLLGARPSAEVVAAEAEHGDDQVRIADRAVPHGLPPVSSGREGREPHERVPEIGPPAGIRDEPAESGRIRLAGRIGERLRLCQDGLA